jgi:hypothetical protein
MPAITGRRMGLDRGSAAAHATLGAILGAAPAPHRNFGIVV